MNNERLGVPVRAEYASAVGWQSIASQAWSGTLFGAVNGLNPAAWKTWQIAPQGASLIRWCILCKVSSTLQSKVTWRVGHWNFVLSLARETTSSMLSRKQLTMASRPFSGMATNGRYRSWKLWLMLSRHVGTGLTKPCTACWLKDQVVSRATSLQGPLLRFLG